MGMRNINLAYAHWPEIPGRAFQVLVWMSKIARDDDDPPECYQGREKLCIALGRKVPDAVDEDHPDHAAISAERRAAFKLLADNVATLREWGAIDEVQRARPGRGARYALNLSPERAEAYKKPPEKRVKRDPKTVDRSTPVRPENRVQPDPRTVSSATRNPGPEVPENRDPEEEETQTEEEIEETSQLTHPQSVRGPAAARAEIRRARTKTS